MVKVIEDPDGQNLSTDYVFDTLGNLRKTIQGEQNRYFTYDSLGRLLYAKQPEQEANPAFITADALTTNSRWSVKYEYDDNGNITKTTDARGVYVEGVYDNFNRLKVRNYSDDTPDVSFYYDGKGLTQTPDFAKGKTTKVSSSVSESRYTSFNNLGNLLAHSQTTDGNTYNTSYQYDTFGRLQSETYPSGRTVNYEFNQDGEISRIGGTVGTANRLYVNGISHNSAGGIERMRLGNGKWETAKYNNRQQITEIGLGNSATDQSLLKLEYDYGTITQNNGSMRSQKISFNGLANAFEQIYNYDDLNRLQSAEEKVNNTTNWKQTFQYDRYGNRRFDAANTTTLAQNNNLTNPEISTATNRFAANQNYAYDQAGNLTQDALGNQFLYDAENHQKQIKNAGNQIVGEYLYDGEGKRVKKKSNTETTIFVYNGGGTLVAEYSTNIVPQAEAKISYLTQDHLGSPRIITDDKGQIIARKDFGAFGDETFTAQRTTALGYKPENIRQDYTGYQKDDESGLEFAQARYYNSQHGRFTSIDPLTASANVKDPQTFNRYTYALNSPYKFTDPLGLIASCCSEKEIKEQIKKDFSQIIYLDNPQVSVSPTEEELNTVADKLYPTYYQAAKEAYDAQSAKNDEINTGSTGIVKTKVEITTADPTVATTTTTNGNLGGTAGAGAKVGESVTIKPSEQGVESDVEGSENAQIDASLSTNISTTVTKPGTVNKTTTEAEKPPSSADAKLKNANGNITNLAEKAAASINGTKVRGLRSSDNTMGEVTINVNGITMTSLIRQISNAGKAKANLDNPPLKSN